MSFREKSVWISFVLILLASGVYFGNIARVLTGRSGHQDAPLFLGLILAVIVLELALHAIAASGSPTEARMPRDERERLIAMRATQVAFPVFVVAALASIGLMHLRVSTWEMAHATLLAIVIAELVKLGTEIRLYRRDR